MKTCINYDTLHRVQICQAIEHSEHDPGNNLSGAVRCESISLETVAQGDAIDEVLSTQFGSCL